MIIVNGVIETRGRPNWTWVETIKKNKIAVNLSEGMTLDRLNGRKSIDVSDPESLG